MDTQIFLTLHLVTSVSLAGVRIERSNICVDKPNSVDYRITKTQLERSVRDKTRNILISNTYTERMGASKEIAQY